jgi:diaminopimelate decarboxylase
MAAALDTTLLPDTAVVTATDIVVGGCSLTDLAATYGTPLFVYDEATLRARARAARGAFDDGVAFASKSFLCGAMAVLAVEEGLCLDVSTAGELDLVLRAGVPAARIVLHGNNKTDDELRRAITVGVRQIVVDSFGEIERLARLVPGHNVDVMVRVTPGVAAHTHEFIQTGQEDTKFGFSLATGDAHLAVRQLLAIPGVTVRGVHLHIGSQIFDVGSFEKTVDVVAPFLHEHGVAELCIGGGLGVAYVNGEVTVSLGDWARSVRSALARHGLGHLVLTAEPGRSIVAQAGVTVYTAGTRKRAAGRAYLAVDGGMSDNPRPVLYGSGYEAVVVQRPLAERTTTYRIVGKHCESGDVLIDEAWLPDDVAPGDLIATPVTGAYGYAMASNYNRAPRPAVVFVADGVARVVLRRESLDDLVRLDTLLA